MVSRVGSDMRGERVAEAMSSWGMNRSGIQIDEERPTGEVNVRVEDGNPSFDILLDQAYDHIDSEAAVRAASGIQSSLLYHGTLGLRDQGAQRALHRLRERADTVFLDLNLRPPWSNPEVVDDAVRGTTWLKLNETELETLHGGSGTIAIENQMQDVQSRYDLGGLLVTLGDKGAIATTGEGTWSAPSVRSEAFVDSVGAGDSFSAVWIVGLLHGWDLNLTLARAASFAARIVAQRGAISENKPLYEREVGGWR